MNIGCVPPLSIGFPQITNATGPLLEIQTGPTDYLVLSQIILSEVNSAAGAGQVAIGLGKPAARGVGNIGSALLAIDDEGNTSVLPGILIYTNWATLPTAPTNFFRRMTLSTSSGRTPCNAYTFQAGLKILPSSSLVLWVLSGNLGNSSFAMDANVVFDS